MSKFYVIVARQMPEFYMKIAQKIFFLFFWGGGHVSSLPPVPVSYAYVKTVYFQLFHVCIIFKIVALLLACILPCNYMR